MGIWKTVTMLMYKLKWLNLTYSLWLQGDADVAPGKLDMSYIWPTLGIIRMIISKNLVN